MSQMDWMAQRYERTSAPDDCSPANTGWTRFNKCSASIGLLRPVLPATDSLPALADYRAKLDRPEFVRKALDAWADEHGVRLQFIRPGKPVENAHIESFNGRLREECLNQHLSVFLRKLVHSILRQVDFPGYDNAERKGSDGFVEAIRQRLRLFRCSAQPNTTMQDHQP
jgi:transposase InsO family protein